jgi:hypothetical protein
LKVRAVGAAVSVGLGFLTDRVTGMLIGLLPAPAEETRMLVVWLPAPRLVGLAHTLRLPGVLELAGVTTSQGAAGLTATVKSSAVEELLLLMVTVCAGGNYQRLLMTCA